MHAPPTSATGLPPPATYGVYGPAQTRCATESEVLYEGMDTPDRHRHFQIIEKYGVTIYYTAPTLIRMFMVGP